MARPPAVWPRRLSNIFGGLVPDAFDPTPGVPVQCPEPGGALSQQKGEFGTCTMHPTQIDYAQLLSEVRPDLFAGLKNLNLPLVNHSHIIRGTNFKPVWWHLKVILVTDQNAWPDVNAHQGNSLGRRHHCRTGRGSGVADDQQQLLLVLRITRAAPPLSSSLQGRDVAPARPGPRSVRPSCTGRLVCTCGRVDRMGG